MKLSKFKTFLYNHWMYYAVGLLLVFGIKYFYSRAGSEELNWILAPTARWVRILCGIPFDYDPSVGYVNYSYRFIIAASCSGVQFLVISTAALIFSFVHRMRTRRGGVGWIAVSLGISYLFTIFVNGFRIVLSIYLPIYLRRFLYGGWLTPDRLHTLIGVTVYFTSLFTLYQTMDYVSRRISKDWRNGRDFKDAKGKLLFGKVPAHLLGACVPPIFWYVSIVLGIPLLNRAYRNDWGDYWEYAALIAGICGAVLAVFCVGLGIFKWMKGRGAGTREGI